MIRNRHVAILVTCALGLVLLQNRAEAQTRSFSIIGGGLAPKGLPLPGQAPRAHWSIGVGTGLGEYFGDGTVQTDTASFNSDGTITGEFGSGGPYVFTGAKGDQLACFYGRTDYGAESPGTFTLVPVPEYGEGWYVAYFVAEFVPYAPDCTGIFAGVTGGWTMYASTAPFLLGSTEPIAYEWEGQGTLTFADGSD
jgi:hypothetical protein